MGSEMKQADGDNMTLRQMDGWMDGWIE